MNYNYLGNSDIKISSLCLGTMTFGEQNNELESFKIMDCASDLGINFLDTAEIYSAPINKKSYGVTEQIIGKWLKTQRRDKVVIGTKIAGPHNKKAFSWIPRKSSKYNEENITQAVNDSLKRLKTDYIDLYQLHTPIRETNFFGRLGYIHSVSNNTERFEEVLHIFQKIIKQGKIRSLGISNETPWGLTQYLETSKIKNLPKVVSIQNPYNLLNRTFEVGLAEVSIKEKCGLIGYSPLAFGYLTGKYRKKKFPKKSRMKLYFKYFNRYKTPNASKAIEEYYKISKKYKISLTNMAIKFCEMQQFSSSTIIGVTNTAQLEDNVNSLNANLSKNLLSEIEKVQKIFPNPCP